MTTMDLIGKKKNWWTVIGKSSRRYHWIVQCKCGFVKEMSTSSFNSGRSGRCINCKKSLPRIDRTGEKVGSLTVIGYAGKFSGARGGKPEHHWKCLCECGNTCNVRTDHIKPKFKNKTCGCGRSGNNNWGWKGVGELSGQKWNHICKSARDRNIPMELTQEEAWELFLKQDRKCAITGWELTMYEKSRCVGKGKVDASLDRIDSSLSYKLDNVQWVHKNINQAKNDLGMEEFLLMCRAVVNYS